MKNLFEKLNESQRAAVSHIDGPSLVIAGAGSGKTRVLTYKIAYLLSQNVPAQSILALTFTNKAAAEMKERIQTLVGDQAQYLAMGTFHSIFARILRFEAANLPGYDANYTILDAEDVKKQIAQVIKELDVDKETYKPSKVASIISKAKNDLIPAEMYELSDAAKYDSMNGMPAISKIYKRYVADCKRANSMDFDDLLLMTNILFRDNPLVLQKYQRLFQYILVDEFQDTNSCQYRIIKQLAMPENNLCVVGDDAQSIYSFRGARIENILNYQRDYANCKLFKLEQNYRSTKTIVDAANSLIKKNTKQIPKKIFSEQEQGEKISVMQSGTDAEEGIKVAMLIAGLIENGESYSDCAILYRTNSQSRILEEALNKKRIPCKIVKGTSFFQRKEIKDVLSYMRVVVNPKDELALERIINYPVRGIGNTTIERLRAVAEANSLTLWGVISQIERTGDLFPAAAKKKLSEFAQMMQSFIVDEPNADAYSLMFRIVEKIGIKEAIEKENTKEEALDRFNNIQELLNGAKEFVENELDPDAIALHLYLQKIALLTDIDEEDVNNPDKVLLMTIHAAKGLEFKHCFLVGMEENVLPSMMSMESAQNIEEERRLFYVALTRAMKTVTMSFAWKRRKFGNFTPSTPSRFLSEIDSCFLNGSFRASASMYQDTMQTPAFSSYKQTSNAGFSGYQNTQGRGISSPSQKPSSSSATQSSFSHYQKEQPFAHYNEKAQQPTTIVPSSPEAIQVGLRVAHAKFGMGSVKERMGTDANAAVIIAFDNWGEKKLLLKFAKLQVVENL